MPLGRLDIHSRFMVLVFHQGQRVFTLQSPRYLYLRFKYLRLYLPAHHAKYAPKKKAVIDLELHRYARSSSTPKPVCIMFFSNESVNVRAAFPFVL